MASRIMIKCQSGICLRHPPTTVVDPQLCARCQQPYDAIPIEGRRRLLLSHALLGVASHGLEVRVVVKLTTQIVNENHEIPAGSFQVKNMIRNDRLA